MSKDGAAVEKPDTSHYEAELPGPWSRPCPKCGVPPGARCLAVSIDDQDRPSSWRLMPRTSRTLEAHLHTERFASKESPP